jgi:hypothetical protein
MRHNPRLHGLQFFLFLVLGLEVADDGLLASPVLAAGFTCLPLLVQVVWSWLSCLLPRTAIPFVDWPFRKTTGYQFLFPWPSPCPAPVQTLNWMHPGLSLALHLLMRGEVIAAFAGLWHAEPLRASDRLLVPCFNQTFLAPGRWALGTLQPIPSVATQQVSVRAASPNICTFVANSGNPLATIASLHS